MFFSTPFANCKIPCILVFYFWITNYHKFINFKGLIISQVCGSEVQRALWGSLLRGPQGRNQGVGQPGSQLAALVKNPLDSTCRLLGRFIPMRMYDQGPRFLTACRRGAPPLLKAVCVPWHMPPSTSKAAKVLSVPDFFFCCQPKKTLLFKGTCYLIRPTWIISSSSFKLI